MRPFTLRKTAATLAAVLGLGGTTQAEDIDLFTSPGGGGITPNILIVLDNSANWNRNDQAWVGINGESPFKQGQSELRALRNLMDDPAINNGVNLGLFMMVSGGPADSGYPRFHIRPMNAVNKAAFKELIGDAACADGPNSLNGTPNCIFKNFSSASEQTNSASTRYSAALFEVFKYFGGYTDPARALLDQPGAPVDRTHFGQERYGALSPNTDRDAWQNPGLKTHWMSPLDSLGNPSCAKNYVIFIGNGYPSQDVADALLTGINGNAASPPGVGSRNFKVANWAKYMFSTDVNAAVGRQNIYTYTIDVFNRRPDADQTALLRAMAKYGGGRYFEARNEQAIIDALKQIVIEIQSINSVFASASLPINATNRSQNENQVFIGMFRPDADARPKWYGNLKQFQISLFGNQAKLADKDGQEAIAATTGFIQACSTSFWTSDSGQYWDWSIDSTGSCSTVPNSAFSDLPDGGIVEKGGAAEVVRRGNDPSATAPFTVNRNMLTCAGTCGALTAFNDTNVTSARTGAASAAEHTAIINFARGQDVLDENGASAVAGATSTTEPRPSIHGDIAHSRPLPVNYGGSRGVIVYYGANDGTFKAVEGNTGKELWSFVAPEHHHKLKRLWANTPLINYPTTPPVPGGQSKDYFFDGSSGLFQNADNSKVWIFPTMRRGGRMLYAFDVTGTTPSLLWAKGCDAAGVCSGGFNEIGQTWSGMNLAFLKEVSTTVPVVIVGGGYDTCLDSDVAVTTCTATAKGKLVYVLNAQTGAILATFPTDAPVAADVTLIDRDFDGFVDAAYVADALGSIYRIDFATTAEPITQLASGGWTITKVAFTNGGNRKFLFGPAAIAVGANVYLGLGSGDRERPLITNYPYVTNVTNRFYMFIDNLTPGAINLDGGSMQNFSASTNCDSVVAAGMRGWYMDLSAGRGEQTVTSAVIFGGAIFFSTNRPVPPLAGSCATNLGEARGYAVNLLNASGVIGTGALCGGTRSGVFTGGGIPPSPVVGIVPVRQPDGSIKPTNVLIGGINLDTGSGSPIGAQEPKIPIKQIRSRVYWYPHGER